MWAYSIVTPKQEKICNGNSRSWKDYVQFIHYASGKNTYIGIRIMCINPSLLLVYFKERFRSFCTGEYKSKYEAFFHLTLHWLNIIFKAANYSFHLFKSNIRYHATSQSFLNKLHIQKTWYFWVVNFHHIEIASSSWVGTCINLKIKLGFHPWMSTAYYQRVCWTHDFVCPPQIVYSN